MQYQRYESGDCPFFSLAGFFLFSLLPEEKRKDALYENVTTQNSAIHPSTIQKHPNHPTAELPNPSKSSPHIPKQIIPPSPSPSTTTSTPPKPLRRTTRRTARIPTRRRHRTSMAPPAKLLILLDRKATA
jgi:hypothetical protein